MKKLINNIIIFGVLIVGFNQLSAQTIISNDNTKSNRAYAKAGIDPATMFRLGYERQMGLTVIEKQLVTYAEWGFSVANLKNSELKVGGVLSLIEKGNFKIVNNLNLSAGTLTAKNFDSKKFAIADEIALGIYKQKWSFALTAEYEKFYLNHIEHSDFYRATYYEDAIDGWYKGAGGMFQFGIEWSRILYERFDLNLELKMPFTEKFHSYRGSPAHINLGVGYRF